MGQNVGPRVASLHVYPVKGARGISLERAEIVATGLRHDRRFMVVRDDDGLARTQREHARLALVEVAIDAETQTLTVRAGGSSITVDLAALDASGAAAAPRARRQVRLFRVETEGVDVGPEAADFFSTYLGERCSLVFMPKDVVRRVEAPFGEPGDHVSFADGFPLLIASLASLADLNDRLVASGSAPIPMNRFRPNIVVDGAEAWVEDDATRATIGPGPCSASTLTLRTPKKCDRCQVTTIDQATATAGKEPLRALAKFRADANKVNFAINAIPRLAHDAPPAVIAIGDPIAFAFT